MENDTKFIDEQIRIADSYPHDDVWKAAVATVAAYNAGVCSADGRANE